MRAVRSLRGRLLAGVLSAVAMAWIAVSLSGYWYAREELDELFDAHLAQSAALLVAQLPHAEEGDDDDHELELEFEHAPLLHRYARNVAFQVWERGRRLRVHSVSAPRERLSSSEKGFSDGVSGEERWRVFSTWALDRRVLVQVGERVDARDAVSREIAEHLLLPLVVALPLLALGLLIAIGRGLAPLAVIADAVASRDPARLEPLALSGTPLEIRPLVERLNSLFARISQGIERERTFTADAAHELRTPLAAIRAQAQVAHDATDAAERRRALELVMAGCDRAAHLSTQLLTLARLEADAWQGRMVPCDLVPIAREVLAEVAPEAHARRVALELVGDPTAVVPGDATLLHVLLRNLVDNAVRYGPEGGCVRVIVQRAGSALELSVSDEGPGLAAVDKPRVTDRFYRGLGTSETGAGLGLSISARIAELHGAALAFTDAAGGRGFQVRVRFPEAAFVAA